jgi:hypothetical protein
LLLRSALRMPFFATLSTELHRLGVWGGLGWEGEQASFRFQWSFEIWSPTRWLKKTSKLAEGTATFLLFLNLHLTGYEHQITKKNRLLVHLFCCNEKYMNNLWYLSFFFSKYLCKDAFLLVEPSKKFWKEKRKKTRKRRVTIIVKENGAMS